MNEKQAQSLIAYLNGFLSSPFTKESSEHYTIYLQIRDYLQLNGPEDFCRILKDQSSTEHLFGNVNYNEYKQIHDILYGEQSKIPPLIDKFPILCSWRLDCGC